MLPANYRTQRCAHCTGVGKIVLYCVVATCPLVEGCDFRVLLPGCAWSQSVCLC